ncbi:MAG: DUF1801 domain-containing protein [Bacteroidota bacterium]
MVAVDDFIQNYEGEQRKILNYLHLALADELELIPKIRYKIPFYYKRSWICYLNPTKRKTVDFCFLRGNELSNQQELLSGKGRKQVMSIEIAKLSDLPEGAIKEVIHEALLLDESVPYSVKSKK